MKLAYEIMKHSQSQNQQQKVGEYLIFESDHEFQLNLLQRLKTLEHNEYKPEQMLQLGGDFANFAYETVYDQIKEDTSINLKQSNEDYIK